MKVVKGDKIRVAKADNAFANFAGFKIGDEYIVDRADEERGVHLVSDDGNKHLTFSSNILDYYFEKAENEEEKVFYEVDEDDFDFTDEILSESQIVFTNVFDKCVIVACRLPNGFVIVESFCFVSPEYYDEKLGIDYCMSRIKAKIMELEEYRMAYNDMEDEDCNPCPYEDCDNCPCVECK